MHGQIKETFLLNSIVTWSTAGSFFPFHFPGSVAFSGAKFGLTKYQNRLRAPSKVQKSFDFECYIYHVFQNGPRYILIGGPFKSFDNSRILKAHEEEQLKEFMSGFVDIHFNLAEVKNGGNVVIARWVSVHIIRAFNDLLFLRLRLTRQEQTEELGHIIL